MDYTAGSEFGILRIHLLAAQRVGMDEYRSGSPLFAEADERFQESPEVP